MHSNPLTWIPIAIPIKMGLMGFYFAFPGFDERPIVRQPRVKVKAKVCHTIHEYQKLTI